MFVRLYGSGMRNGQRWGDSTGGLCLLQAAGLVDDHTLDCFARTRR